MIVPASLCYRLILNDQFNEPFDLCGVILTSQTSAW